MTVRDDFNAHLQTLEQAGYSSVASSLRKVSEVLGKYSEGRPEEEVEADVELLLKAFPPPEKEEEKEEAPEGTKCPDCGAANSPEATECAECGAALSSEEAEEEAPPAEGEEADPDANPDEQGMQEQDPAAMEEEPAAAREDQAVQKVQLIVIDLLEELGLVEKAEGVVKAVDLQATVNGLQKNHNENLRTLAGDVAQVAILVEDLAEGLAKRVHGAAPVLRDMGQLIPGYAQKAAEVEQLKKNIEAETNPMVKDQLQQQLSRKEIALSQARQLGE